MIEDWVVLYEPFVRAALFVLGLVFFGILEIILPYRIYFHQKKRRWLDHVFLITLGTGVVRGLFHCIPILFAMQVATQKIGILYELHCPYGLSVLIAIVSLDCFMYLQHRAMHRFSLLWQIHKVHHIDKALDVTTGIRFHPLEILVMIFVKFIAIIFIGAPVLAVFIYEVMFSFFTQFTHANIRLPKSLERMLRTVVVTPPMHRIHHSDIPFEHDSNFGFCFSFWDKLFKTYRGRIYKREGKSLFGLEGYFAPRFQTLTSILLLAFNTLQTRPQKIKPIPKMRL